MQNVMKVDLAEWYRNNPENAPRGRGGWLFRVTWEKGTEMRSCCGTYTDARRKALAYAKAVKASEVVLLP